MGKPLRVAQIVGKVVLSGVDCVVMDYYRHIDREKIQFDFFMDGEGPSPVDAEILAMGGRIYKLPPYGKALGRNLAAFRNRLKENGYAVVHCHLNTLSVFWLREAKRAGVPVRIAHSHSTIGRGEGLRTWVKYALRPLAKLYPTHYCACGDRAAADLFGERFARSGKVRIVRNAVDVDRFAYDPALRQKTRQALGISDQLVVGHVGRFMYQKNHAFLLKVFAALREQQPDARLLMVGDGETRGEMEALARSLGLGDAALFLGLRRDLPALYQAMDAFVLPSHYEGLPVVGVEAQAAGLPVLFSDRIAREAAITRRCRFLPLGDPGLWAEAVLASVDGERNAALPGYSIAEESGKLQEYYLGLVE